MTTAAEVRSRGTIARILEAAQSLFLARSYADVTIDDIAAEADVTKGAVYHHFASKEELYLAMMNADFEEKASLFQRVVGSAEGCRARLRALTSAYFSLPPAKRDLIHLVRRDSNAFGEPTRSSLVRAYQAALPNPVETILLQGMRSGELRGTDPRLLSWQFVAIVEVTLNRYADGLFPDPDSRLDYVLDLFFSGVHA
jgi:AcrR family transcriptional regulator